MAHQGFPVPAEPVHDATSTRASGRRATAAACRCATMAREIAWYFRHAIRRYSDPFSVRHLFAILSGRAPSMLELPDRPAGLRRRGPPLRVGHGAPAASRSSPAARCPRPWRIAGTTSRSTPSSTRATRSARRTGAARRCPPALSPATPATVRRRARRPRRREDARSASSRPRAVGSAVRARVAAAGNGNGRERRDGAAPAPRRRTTRCRRRAAAARRGQRRARAVERAQARAARPARCPSPSRTAA